MTTRKKYTELIKSEANRLGFISCGISKSDFLEQEAPRLEKWLNKNMNGEMKYMENHFDKRLDTTKLVLDSKSVVSLLYNYYPSQNLNKDKSPKISKYAYGADYQSGEESLLDFIKENIEFVNMHLLTPPQF